MKATIDLPEDLYRRVKARSAEQGRRIREVAAELFRNWLDQGSEDPAAAPPVIDANRLARHGDAASLRKAYPNGYRLRGPILSARPGVPEIAPAAIERAMMEMDEEELTAHARAH